MYVCMYVPATTAACSGPSCARPGCCSTRCRRSSGSTLRRGGGRPGRSSRTGTTTQTWPPAGNNLLILRPGTWQARNTRVHCTYGKLGKCLALLQSTAAASVTDCPCRVRWFIRFFFGRGGNGISISYLSLSLSLYLGRRRRRCWAAV